jgi:regulator of protease activity HflC (stomatin/prohibitin superfamily)
MTILYLLIPITIIFLSGIRKIHSRQCGLIERFGKYYKFVNPGFYWIIPLIDKLSIVNVDEQMVDAGYLEIVTYDKHYAYLNAKVSFKVKADEKSIKGIIYNKHNVKRQIINLTRSSLRNIINSLPLRSTVGESDNIKTELHNTLTKEINNWGIEILEIELKKRIPDIDLIRKGEDLQIYYNSFVSNLN